jgi:choline-sulfatase
VQDIRADWYHNMSSVFEAGPAVRTNQLDFDEEVIYKATHYLYDHVRHRAPQPFCLTVSMTHPHDPYAMTKEFWDQYEDVDIPLPKTPAIPHLQQDPHSQRVLKCIDLWGKEIPEERIKAARRAYYAACTYVDTQVGKLLSALDNCGLTEDTIVVFTGDHGDMLGERGLWYKMVWYENSARVPLIVHAPNRFAPKRVTENVSTMDLLPTFVSMVGAQLQPQLPLDGVSLMPYITGEGGVKTDTVLGEYMAEGTWSPVVMIRRGRWKFIYSLIDPPMLFDLVADPSESVNIAAGLPVASEASIASSGKARISPSAVPSQSRPTTLPTPDGTPEALLPILSTVNSFFPKLIAAPTPPRTPSPSQTGTDNLPLTTDPATVLAHFIAEAHARWDLQRIHQEVLHSQRRRRLVYSALTKGVPTYWDYEPRVDPSTQYIRNQGKGILDDVEYLSRWPRVVKN